MVTPPTPTPKLSLWQYLFIEDSYLYIAQLTARGHLRVLQALYGDPWGPARDDSRLARLQRSGQRKKKLRVYRVVSSASVSRAPTDDCAPELKREPRLIPFILSSE